MQGDGAFPGGMYDGMDIRMESECVLTGESTNPCKLIRDFLIKPSVDLMGLAAAAVAVGLTTVTVGVGAGLTGFVLGWITVMAQFILTTANLSHDGRPRMVGPGVSAPYQ